MTRVSGLSPTYRADAAMHGSEVPAGGWEELKELGVRRIELRESAQLEDLLQEIGDFDAQPATTAIGAQACQEPRPRPRASALLAFSTLMRLEMKTDLSYRFKLVMQAGMWVVWAGMVYFMAQVYRQDGGMGAAMFHNPMGFLLIGLGAQELSKVCMGQMGRSLRESQLLGTLEPLLVTGRNPLLFVLAPLPWHAGTLLLLMALVFASTHAVLGWQANPAWIAGGLAALLGCAAVGSLGLISAAFVLRFKRGDPVGLLVNIFGLLAAGVYFPRSVLPEWLQAATVWLPHTSGVQAVRAALLAGEGFASSTFLRPFTHLIAFTACIVPVALALWRLAYSRARSLGVLTGV
ncbi:MAG: ABC transporter permease [Planctomycetota bacterium]